MSPGRVSERIVTARLAWAREMAARIRALPLDSFEAFASDDRNAAAAESYLRRAIEAVLDLGRHLLAKAFAVAATEYKQIPVRLCEAGVIGDEQATLLARLAGYRNRLVHFYHEIGDRELYDICAGQLVDVDAAVDAIAAWVAENPERVEHDI